MSLSTSSVLEVADKEFDFVIIGGGTAGCVLARRLSDLGQFTIAILEDGKSHINDLKICDPHGWMSQINDKEYDWDFLTVPQEYANGNRGNWNRGKGLGGSSTINLMAWTRPGRKEIGVVGKLGNEGWNWETFVENVKKSERFCLPDPPFKRDWQNLTSQSVGHSGPIPISFARTDTGIELPMQKALEHIGITRISDFLDGEIHGVFKGVSTIDPVQGTRVSAAEAYLFPALGRSNLKVLVEARVNNIITSEENGKLVARGVEFEHGGHTYKVRAKREVLLCAGAIQSPKILELSGIGDPKILKPLGIPVQLELPAVGTNVQEHVACSAAISKMAEDKALITSLMLLDPVFASKLQVSSSNSGFKTPPFLAFNCLAFVSLQAFSENTAQILERQSAKIRENADKYPPGLLEQYKYQLENLADRSSPDVEVLLFPFHLKRMPLPPDPHNPYARISCAITHPFSRGTIHVASANPTDPPIIDPHYFEDETDLNIMAEGVKLVGKLCKTEPLKSYIAGEVVPGAISLGDDDEKIQEMIRNRHNTVWHTCGSLSMLPRDKGGVVDSKLKVYGTKNIRVVDLSIWPLMIASHTQALVYGIAEQASGIIKADNT